jgi:hypothetical protein
MLAVRAEYLFFDINLPLGISEYLRNEMYFRCLLDTIQSNKKSWTF